MALSERKRRILSILEGRIYGVGFNELCRRAQGLASRQTVKNELDELVRLGFVVKEGGLRGGQRVYYKSKALVETFNSDVKKFLEAIREAGLERRLQEFLRRAERVALRQKVRPPKLASLVPFTRRFGRAIASFFTASIFAGLKYSPEVRERLIAEFIRPIYDAYDKIGATIKGQSELAGQLDIIAGEGFSESLRKAAHQAKKQAK